MILILGPRAPGKDINMYLWSLVDKLKELWEQWVRTCDVLNDEEFTMRVVVLWMINDFLAYDIISR